MAIEYLNANRKSIYNALYTDNRELLLEEGRKILSFLFDKINTETPNKVHTLQLSAPDSLNYFDNVFFLI